MLLERFYDDKLAQASYLLGCQATGQALVVDPNRDVEQYLRVAKAKGVRITQVTETHIHADFASGARELAERAGARLLLSDCGDADWKYAFAADASARLLRDGDVIMVGNLRVDVMHTPGHTPEHVVFVVTDTPATSRPIGVFTGDFVFVGDVGRPDLLERAANVAGTMESSARALHASLQRFAALPDHLQLWPGHGAGSACGKALGAMPSTTLGYERIANWAFGAASEQAFVDEVLAGQPEPPRYFAQMKQLNRDGVPALGALPEPAEVRGRDVADVLAAGDQVLDLRAAPDFARRHLPGTLGVPLNKSFTNWAGALLDYDRDLWLVASGGAAQARDAARDLAMIGFDRVRGWIDADHALAGATDSTEQVTPADVAAAVAAGSLAVLDVRNGSEWSAGHLPGATHVPLGQLAARLGEVPRDRPLVVQCQGGTRSAVAASLLKARGITDVRNLAGGYGAWHAAGLPVELDDHASLPSGT